jgi:hypothetical protein
MRRIFVFLPIAAIVFILFSCSKDHSRLNAPYFYWYTQRLDSLGLKTGIFYREFSSSASDSIRFNPDSSITEIAYIATDSSEHTVTFKPNMPAGFQVAMNLANQPVNLLLKFNTTLLYKSLIYNTTTVFKKKGGEVDVTAGGNTFTIALP